MVPAGGVVPARAQFRVTSDQYECGALEAGPRDRKPSDSSKKQHFPTTGDLVEAGGFKSHV